MERGECKSFEVCQANFHEACCARPRLLVKTCLTLLLAHHRKSEGSGTTSCRDALPLAVHCKCCLRGATPDDRVMGVADHQGKRQPFLAGCVYAW